MKKIILFIALFVGIINSSYGQSRYSIGGSFGLQFGEYTSVNIAPQVGYNFSRYFTLGAGVGYTYYKDKIRTYSNRYNYTSSYAGVNTFARVYPIPWVVLSVQPEANYMWRTVKSGNGTYKSNKLVPSVLAGGGLRLYGVLAMIQYDVIQDKNTPYHDKIIYTVGYCFDF